MSGLSTADRVRNIIAEHLRIVPAGLDPKASLVGDLSADSLDTVEIVISLEDEFNIEVTDEIAETWQTVGDYVGGVEKLLAARVAA